MKSNFSIEWLAFQSNGRLKATWQFPKKFYRVPREAASYGVVGFDSNTHRPLISDIVNASDPDVNYSGVDELFIYMPDSLTDSEPGRNPFDGILSQIGVVNFTTPEGTILHIKGSGTVSKQEQYGLKPTLWALWAHDLLHSIGVEGHNPVEAFTLESEDYVNHVVSGWNQWLLGWTTTEQIACIDKTVANNMEVDLVPLQLPTAGHRRRNHPAYRDPRNRRRVSPKCRLRKGPWGIGDLGLSHGHQERPSLRRTREHFTYRFQILATEQDPVGCAAKCREWSKVCPDA